MMVSIYPILSEKPGHKLTSAVATVRLQSLLKNGRQLCSCLDLVLEFPPVLGVPLAKSREVCCLYLSMFSIHYII